MSADEAARHPEVGSLAQEATALLGALSGWVQDVAAGPGTADDAPDGQERDDQQRGDQERDDQERGDQAAHEGTCRGCPVCRVLHAARRPEVRQHLLDAGTSLLGAFAALLETPHAHAAPTAGSAAGRRVTRIRVHPEGHEPS